MLIKHILTESLQRTNALKKQQEMIDDGYEDVKVSKNGEVYEIQGTEQRFGTKAYWAVFPAGNIGELAYPLDELLKYPEQIFHLCVFVAKGRLPQVEATLSQDAEYSYRYARDVLHGRFPAAEETIAKSAWLALLYAVVIIKGPWPPGEAAIASEASEAYRYARDVIRGRWPPGEAVINNSMYKDLYQSLVYSTLKKK